MWAVCPLCLLAMTSQTGSINDHVSHLPPLYIEQSTDMCSHPYDVVVDDWNS